MFYGVEEFESMSGMSCASCTLAGMGYFGATELPEPSAGPGGDEKALILGPDPALFPMPEKTVIIEREPSLPDVFSNPTSPLFTYEPPVAKKDSNAGLFTQAEAPTFARGSRPLTDATGSPSSGVSFDRSKWLLAAAAATPVVAAGAYALTRPRSRRRVARAQLVPVVPVARADNTVNYLGIGALVLVGLAFFMTRRK